MRQFRDAEAQYRRWIAENPEAFVLNTRRTPDPSYLILHRATCGSISTNAGDNYTTGSYMKVGALAAGELEGWADSIGGELRECGLCSPVR